MTYTRFIQWLIFINTFVAETMFRQRDIADKSIDLQIIIKLAVWGFTFAFCAYYYRMWVAQTRRIDRALEVLLLMIITISCFYAPSPLYSAASVFSLVAVFLLMYLSSVTLNNAQILWPFILGSSLVSFISIIVYFVNPDFGRMKEWVGGLHVPGPRLTGITGTANAIGYISALSCLAIYYFRQIDHTTKTWMIGALGALNLTALLMSNSRTALVAMVFAILAAGLVKFSPARFAAALFGFSALVLAALLVDYDALFSMLSRSGDATEIATGTGRTMIWEGTLDLVAMKPLLGWGYASSVQVFPQYIFIESYTPPHAHNAFLQVLFSIGIVGLIVFTLIFAIKLGTALWYRDKVNLAFVLFLLIDGLAEPIAFSSPVTTTALAFALILSLNITPSYRTIADRADPAPDRWPQPEHPPTA